MRSRPTFWIGLCLLLMAGAWFFWPAGDRRTASQNSAATDHKSSGATPDFASTRSASTAPQLFGAAKNPSNTVATATKTNPFPYRLSNTRKSLVQLMGDRKAILLENALIDTGAKLDLAIPNNLQAQGDPGAYIVQARGPVNAAFRAQLAAAGAEIVSYIPNNAYLVRVTAGGAGQLATLAQAVIPYEPYYKVQSPLLAYAQKTLPPGAALNLGLFAGNSADTISQIEKLGGTVLATDHSPFGPIVRVSPPKNWTALAVLPGVQIVEGSHARIHANDLSRLTVGVAEDTVTTTNYMNLDGRNVLVQVNDSGIDATHPDLTGRVFGLVNNDTDGHGTFVAGIIAGDGTKSTTITNAQGSINPGTDFQYRGKAPKANLLSMPYFISDQTLQETAAVTNVLISNNSWNYGGDNAYDLAAASYDAAVRDSLTQVSGSQPVLYVFSAGNAGHSNVGSDNNDGTGGNPDTILSPATAKNVITVGAMEQMRNITNIVTDRSSNSAAVWQPETDDIDQVAGFSSRGNVGIGEEGPNGRYKPDVTAPGTFVVSTRSQQWDELAYYNPTNYEFNTFFNQTIGTNGVLNPSPGISVPANAVAVIITLVSNLHSPVPFPTNLPVYVRKGVQPTTSTYDILTWKNGVSIPPDSGGAIGGIQNIQNGGIYYAVGNTNNFPVSYDLITEIITTNDLGDYFLVLSNLNVSLSGEPPPYYYRYESGTSMAAADVSGVLALMQDFFTNSLHTRPSPVMMKAMLINGARATGNYSFNIANPINPEGWGLISLSNSLPLSITNLVTNPGGGTSNSFFLLDQNPTNALATGDSQTFLVTLNTNSVSAQLPLRVTLAWTDPAGNPAAAIKLVNNLDLVVTNLETGEVFFGNDIPASSTFNAPWPTNGVQNRDIINNIENVFLAPQLGGSYSVTVIGREVNVNAVTAQTLDSAGVFAPNVVQDYSLVISCGDSADGGAINVAANPVISNPTTSQIVTFVTVTNTPLLNQFVGANTPLMGTNTIGVGTNTVWGTNGAITLGMTNQWHFFVVTNVLGYKYAAFITFLPETLSIPRTGAFADSEEDATQPEADIDLYVADPHNPNIAINSTLTNLNPAVIAAADKSLSRGGVEFVTYSNSVGDDVYYIGVKSEAQEASEFGFISIFSQTPFSQTDANGNETVFGVPLPVNIPDGTTTHPGKAYIFAIAETPINVERVVVSNTIVHQNFGDLIGTLDHYGKSTTLNNHAFGDNPPGPYTKIYDDSGRNDIPNSQGSDGPGSLQSFRGQEGVGPWILTEVDSSTNATGSVTAFQLFIEKHRDLTDGYDVFIPPGSWFYTFLDVPPGYTNLTVYATNLPPTIVPQPLELYLNYNTQPDFVNYLDVALLTNSVPPYPGGLFPGNDISYGPPLRPGTYYVGLFNPGFSQAHVYLIAKLNGLASAILPTPETTNSGPNVLDDAVSTSTIFVGATQQIASVNVGLVVNHPRISDLTFTLLSPLGQRVLLMENRGAYTTNGAGDVFVTTNNFAPVTANGGGLPQTNFLNVGQTSGSLTVTWDFFGVPDEMTVYYGTNSATFIPANAIFDTGLISGAGSTNIVFGPGTFTYLTIIMNQFTNPAGANGTAWTYTAGGIQTNYNYLTFTDNTNLTTTPIKFAVPPFVLNDKGTNYSVTDFDQTTNGEYLAPTNIYDARGGWTLTNITQMLVGTNVVMLTNNYNEVSVVTDPANAASGTNFLALASGTIFRQIPMTPGRQFSLSFQYRGPGISGWWRGEGNATDSSEPENNGNNGWLIGRFNFPAGEVGQAFAMADAGSEFQFAGTNTYVQIHQAPIPGFLITESNPPVKIFTSPLDVGMGSGLTVEGWINPTNVSFQQPLVEWLARTPTNAAVTNLVILAGPFVNPATGHYYYLLNNTNWLASEVWARALGGHLVTIDTANEQNWVYDTFASYGNTNRNLWIGLTNSVLNLPPFVWSSGTTNTSYFNWQTNQPATCTGLQHYTAMLGSTNAQPGLWILADNNGASCTFPLTNKMFGVVEVDELQPNGVQFWISVTNMPGTTNLVCGTNGCLYANLVDATNGSHLIISAPGLVVSNVYQHVALTYNTNSGLASLYYNGTNVASTNLGYFLPKTTGDVLLGKDMSLVTNNFYGGTMDEMSIYGRSLSPAEILAIYNVSFLTTNRTIGKFDQSITPALSLAEAKVSLGALTNVLLGNNTDWQSQNFSFIAATNSMLLQISGLEPGMLLDSFNVSEAPLGNLYYFPEQSLSDTLKGQNAYGTWTLQILDNRTGAYITNGNQLISWQLQFVLQSNDLPQVKLGSQEATTVSVPPGEIVYIRVDVPVWANFATNILVSSTLPVDLLFNQTNPPTGSNPNDYTLLTGSTGGIGNPVLAANPPSVPPLLPGQTYYLGVRNPGAHVATAVIRVDYDITALSNGVPVTDTLRTNVTDVERYYVFNVSSNAYEATFQLLNLNGNADLVVRKGAPLPLLDSSDYGSFNTTNADENIYVLTNSAPVPLSAGPWYLGVFRRDAGPVRYTVLAKELLNAAQPVIIDLTNNVPFTFTAGPGAALTNFFRFSVTNSPPSIHFQLYNLSGNGDLTVQTNAPPLAPPFYQTSRQPGVTPEFISVLTNTAQTNLSTTALTNLNADWYLGVPNNTANQITYTILAVLDTNSVFPAFPGAEGAGAGALGGGSLPSRNGGITNTVYHVTQLGDAGAGSLRDGVSSTNRTIVFDLSGTINLSSPLVITNSYLTIAGQTAPGDGITVAGYETSVTNAHDVIIRYVRFRPGGAAASPAWFNGFEGGSNPNITIVPQGSYFAGGWHVDRGSVDWLGASYSTPSYAYQGSFMIDLDGSDSGEISTNISTIPGVTYTLGFAYTRSPGVVATAPQAQILINGSPLAAVTANLVTTPANLHWQTTSFVFTATSPSTTITFNSLDPSGSTSGVFLDSVSASPAPIWSNGFEGTVPPTSTIYAPGNIAGWAIVSGSVDWYGFGGYQGSNFYDSDGEEPSLISTNFATVSGKTYTLSYAFAMTDYSGTTTPKLTRILIDGVPIKTNVATVSMRYTNWSTASVVFTATSASTTLAVESLDPPGELSGTFMDAFSVTPNLAATGSSGNALRFVNASNVIADHVSASWSLQQVTAVLNSKNLTVQWSMIADSLYSTATTNGGTLLKLGNGALTLHHNLYANNFSSSPHLNDNLSLDFVNNIIYGWGTNAGFSFGDPAVNPVGFTNRLNYVCNYLIAGSSSFAPTIAFRGGSTNTWIFQTNNFIDSNTNHILDGANTSWAMFTNQFTKIGQPFPLAPVATDEAYKAYERVLDFAGLSLMARDSADTNTVTGVRDQTGTIISASGALPVLVSMPQYLDKDLDGIPDFWEITFGQFPTNVSNFLPSSYAPGYTDLEEYLNWLGAPHALTITNMPVSVDLQKLFGNTGNLSFEVTNSVNGVVYLTNVLSYTNALGVGINVTNTGPFSNSIAVFMPNVAPPTNYFGYASFDVTVTNNTTVAYFGPVTVSVVVSSVPITYATSNTNTPPMFLNGTPTNQVINELTTMTVTNTAMLANTNLTLSYVVTMIVDTNAMNLNGWPLTYATTTPSPVIDTNGIITWTPTELQGPGVYVITTVVTDNSFPPLSETNSFSVTVNESNMPPFWPPNVPSQTNYTISALATLIVTNTATDADVPANPLTNYTLSVLPPVANASIDTNGIITWTPTISQVGPFTFTTVVTDTNQFAVNAKSLSATNSFTVFVNGAVAPYVFSQPAQSVTGTSAQLNGMATPNGLPTTAWFEWGTTTNYGTATPVVNVGNSYNVVYTTSPISGLSANVPYHFRLVVSNVFAVVYGFDQILDEANVIVWGANYLGQANAPAGLSNVVAIAGAYEHSLALKINGTAVGWGANNFGQSTVSPGLNNNIVGIAGGETYSLVLKNNGTVAAWGADNIGDGETNVPAGLNNVVMIASGRFSSLALKNSGTVVAWGGGFFGLTNVPAGFSNAVAVAGGTLHSVAIKNDGTVVVWGFNNVGQTNVPGGLTNVVAIAAGNSHSLALKNNGTVVAWGSGLGTNVPPGLNNVVAIAAGGFHSLALKNDGTVVTWGDNSAGQSSVPVGLTNVVAISAGYLHSLALTPQSVSSLTNPIVLNLTNGLPQTNTIVAGGLTYYRVNVPTNADFATNSLLFAFNGPLNVWFTTNTPPTIATFNDSLLLAGQTNGISILSTTSAPPRIVPGATYYLGVNNTNNFAVTYGIEVDFHLLISTNPPPFTNSVPISSIIYTNIGGKPGFLLTWFAPSNALFQVQWTGSLPPASWNTFTNPPFVSYNTNFPPNGTNTQFNFFDDASQTGGVFGPQRFYRLLYGTALPPVNTAPVFNGTPATQTINPLNPLVVTNTATDAQSPPQVLTYTLTSTVVGTNVPAINTNTGVITWTPDVSQAGTSNMFTTVVTDNGTPNLSVANSFSVIVNPVPDISSVVFSNRGFLLTWFAPSNDLFQVQFTDSLVSTNWITFTNIIGYNTSIPVGPANAQFNFYDDGTPYGFTGLRFYRLKLVGLTAPIPPPATNTIPISNVIYTNGNILLTWFAPTNDIFQVQYTDSLAPVNWQNFSNLVTYVGPPVIGNGMFNFLDDGTEHLFTGLRFYRIDLVGITSPVGPPAMNTVPISSIVSTNGNFLLTWFAATNNQFRVQWTTNLVPPNWTLFPGTNTSTTGTFTFLDTNAPLLMKFYELILLP